MPTKPTNEQAPAGSAPATLSVQAVIELVQDWVDADACHLPDFAGAYLWGGITALSADTPFPLYRDVDVVVVTSRAPQEQTLEVLYRGLMLEVIVKDIVAHQDVEAVLANPSHAPNMVATRILADPTGILAPLQQAVIAQFHRRRWVHARCEAEKVMARDFLKAMREVTIPADGLNHLWLVLYALSGLLAVAQLDRPTTRRTLALLRELLGRQGRLDLHERALTLWGSARMSGADVEAMLAVTTIAYDRAVTVYKTPTELGFTLREHLRPYLVEGSREMIREGLHREATFWIVAVAGESYLALQNDAPDAEKPLFAAQWRTLQESLGYCTIEAWRERVASAEHLTEAVFHLADEFVTRHPE